MAVALITGITGQDGYYLGHLLHGHGYDVVGMVHDVHPDDESLHAALPFARFVSGSLTDLGSLFAVCRAVRPDEIYNLASQSSVELSFKLPEATASVTGIGVLRLLEAVRLTSEIAPKFYQASSSEMFGTSDGLPQNERTPFNPQSPYGAAKVFAHHVARNYRSAYGQFNSCGILFNHESPRRPSIFVSRKITWGVARIRRALDRGEPPPRLLLGDLESRRDWGFAGDYVVAMWKMLQQDEPGDYVIASGQSRSVRDFVSLAFEAAGVEPWQEFVDEQQAAYIRPTELPSLVGDASKARRVLGWEPKVTFPALVEMMVDADLRRLRNRS